MFIGLLLFQCKAHKNIVESRLGKLFSISEIARYYNEAIEFSSSGNAYHLLELRSHLGANNAIIEKHKDNIIIEYQFTLIENIVKAAKPSREIQNNQSPFQDNFMTWISTKEDRVFKYEVPLYESYSFFYITQFLYYTKLNGWNNDSDDNQERWKSLLSFVEDHIWTKWYTRSMHTYGNNYRYFLRSRTHMASHWAGVAMYLNYLSKDNEIKKQTEYLVDQYDILLKRNLKIVDRSYVWNATYDNVQNTYATKARGDIVQDVSHGNHVVSYIIAAYEFGNENWSREDIMLLSSTLKNIVFDNQSNTFRDNVDGSSNRSRPGWGSFLADGWVKLAIYDEEAKMIFIRFGRTKLLRRFDQELQFKVNLYKANLVQ